MVDYKSFSNFLSEVKSNNIFNIKSELSNMLFFLKGNEFLLNQAIEFAQENSDFKYEDNIEITSDIDLISPEDYYIFEKGLLLENFSKERVEKVIQLYHQLPKPEIEQNYTLAKYTENKKTVSIKQIAIIAIAFLIVIAIFYTIFKKNEEPTRDSVQVKH